MQTIEQVLAQIQAETDLILDIVVAAARDDAAAFEEFVAGVREMSHAFNEQTVLLEGVRQGVQEGWIVMSASDPRDDGFGLYL